MAVKDAAPRSRRISHPSLDMRLDQGRMARDRTPPSSHAGWSPAADRPDPVGLLEGQDRIREPDLYYWRQLRDMKGSALVELIGPVTLTYYGPAIRSGRLEAVEGV